MALFKLFSKKKTWKDAMDTVIVDLHGRKDTIMNHLRSWSLSGDIISGFDAKWDAHVKDIDNYIYVADYLINNFPTFGDGFDAKAQALSIKDSKKYEVEIENLHRKAINCEYSDILTPIFFHNFLCAILDQEDYDNALRKYNEVKKQYSDLWNKVDPMSKEMLEMTLQMKEVMRDFPL